MIVAPDLDLDPGKGTGVKRSTPGQIKGALDEPAVVLQRHGTLQAGGRTTGDHLIGQPAPGHAAHDGVGDIFPCG
jgi:hypothetical protein